MDTNSYILTIAGFDPSSGAGLTSDIKTFEAFGLYGLSVCTSVTVQNDQTFKASHWQASEVILDQINTLFERFEIDTVKIGIVENWHTLNLIVARLRTLNPRIKIILDPVLKASAGFDFHSEDDLSILDQILDQIFIITPNYDEIKQLYPEKNINETITHISTKTNLYLKGGHRQDKKGWDEIYTNNSLMVSIRPTVDKIYDKHGSGCVLSATLAAYLKLGLSLEEAAVNTKSYMEKFLNSNKSLLGTHSYGNLLKRL